MKMKSFAMLAVSGLLAVSSAYSASIGEEEPMDGESALQAMQLADNSSQNGGVMGNVGGMDNAGDNNATSDNANPSNNDANSATTTPNSNNTGAADEGSPDTATGDDDY